ncbi:MAG: hypothetical protein PHG82_05595 [Candidatus Gracilibacteria bacterium]|nr:hypothetical protein [Candidatus Gracilibacteria bacterium]
MSSGVSPVQQSSQADALKTNIQSQKPDEPEIQQSGQEVKVPVEGKGGNLDIMA